jgi:predicted anti-sigma-YlaC factor YlaD
MSLVLRAIGVWDIVSGASKRPDPAVDAAGATAWDKLDVEEQAILLPTLDVYQTNHVYSCKTCQEMWDKLAHINSDSSTKQTAYSITVSKLHSGS